MQDVSTKIKDEVVKFKCDFIQKYPQHRKEVIELFGLMLDEIDSGESVENEVSLFMSACEDILIEI